MIDTRRVREAENPHGERHLQMNIVNVGYDSTNYYVLADARPRLLVDVGMPGTLPKLRHQCQRQGIDLAQITHFWVTHYHPDHAGIAGDLQRQGCKLIILENQVAAVPALKKYVKPPQQAHDVDLSSCVRLTNEASRAFLKTLGIAGEIVHTPGHSDDSNTLVLDEGVAFTGDLHPWTMAAEESQSEIEESWAKLRALNVRKVYPRHGPARELT